MEPRLLFDWVFADRSRVGAQLGLFMRPSRELENIYVNDQLSSTASAAVNAGARSRGWIILELRTSLGVLEGGGNKNSEMDLLAGGRFDVSPTVSLEAGTGTGSLSGVGTTGGRVFAAVSLRKPTPEPEGDRDRDGHLDSEDGRSDGPEDFDGLEDEDGCSDPDNDNDGVLDVDGGEPNATGFGACRDQAEDMDGDRDEDGCPEEDRMVTVTCDEIEINGPLYFDTDSDMVQTRSYELLEQVAEVLNETAHIHLVSVEGHTDRQGCASHNRDLSWRRAASVVRFLVEAGIAADRLQSGGASGRTAR